MRLTLKFSIFLTGLFWVITTNGQNLKAKSIIIGSWKFDKLEFVGDLAGTDKKEQDKANKMNYGNEITFTADGKYKTVKRANNKLTQLASGNYKILDEGKYLSLDGDKAEIIFIDNARIKFSSPYRPIMVWIKIKS